MHELVPVGEQSPDLTEETESRVLTLRGSLDEMTVNELHAAILWSQAVAAAGRAKRAWKLAREAAELQIRAERKLGEFISSEQTHEEIMERLKREGISSPGRPREVSEETAEYVRKLHSQGLVPSQIARRLNEEGIPSPRGQQWYPPGIIRILSWDTQKSLLDPRDEGAYAAVAAIPQDLFDSVVNDLLERGKSVDPRVVLKVARQQSLEYVEPAIHKSWDGVYYTNVGGGGRYKRSNKRTLEAVREDLYAEQRLSRKQPKQGPSKLIDEAFAEARRYAQALNELRSEIHGEAGDLVGEAELMQAKVASILFDAYRTLQIAEKERRPIRMPT